MDRDEARARWRELYHEHVATMAAMAEAQRPHLRRIFELQAEMERLTGELDRPAPGGAGDTSSNTGD